MSSSSFLIAYLRFSVYSIMSFVNVIVLFLFQFEFLSLLFLLWLPWLGLPELCWIKVVGVSIPRFFLILEEILSAFPNEMMLAVGLSYMSFIMLKYAPSMPSFWRVFIINGCWRSMGVKRFFCLWDDRVVFIVQCVNMVYHSDWFVEYWNVFHLWDEAQWSWYMFILMYCWN